MKPTTIAIVHHDTMGLAHDARVLTAALKATFTNPIICRVVIPRPLADDYSKAFDIPPEVTRATPFDFMFLLEHAHSNPPFSVDAFARYRIYVPNIEWLNSLDEIAIGSMRLDMVMLKNKFSFDVFSALPLAKSVARIEQIGWTSEDVADERLGMGEKDFNQFLHVRGVSMQKQTEIVMETWAKHPEFPLLTIVMRFFGGFELSEPLRYASNVRVFLQEMPPAHLRRLQNRIGIHVCPSKLEGFGHSLNEARAASGILVTTDGPPMNEFVTHGENGFLVPVHESDVSAVGRYLQFNITSDRLAEQIDQLLSLPDSRRRAMGGLSRQKYLSDRDRFYTNLSRWRDSVRAQ